MSVVDRSFDDPLKLEEKAVSALAGGIAQHGYQCGMLWGATLAAGARAYRLLGPGPHAETVAIIAAQGLVESFRARNHDINCLEITGMDWKPSSKRHLLSQVSRFFIRGGPIMCLRMAARYAPEAYNEVSSALSGKHVEASSPPVSCAAVLARRMGASEMHAVMAAGFAGGIGLSGGACGALGAAVWIIGMNVLKEGGKVDYKASRALDTIDRFIRCSEYEFECSKIAGRTFESVSDHASYVRDGGCSRIIEVLAAK